MRILLLLLSVTFTFLNCEKKKSPTKKSYSIENISSTQKKDSLIYTLQIKNEERSKEAFNCYKNKTIELISGLEFQSLKVTSNDNTSVFKLDYYYEYGTPILYYYKTNQNDEIFLIEASDFYGSDLGIYQIVNDKLQKLDFIHFDQNNPDSEGYKQFTTNIYRKNNNIFCKINLGKKRILNKTYSTSNINLE